MTHVVAMGGGGFSEDENNRLTAIDRYILALSPNPHPKVCFVPTASGDASAYIDSFHAAFDAAECEPTHASLFYRGTVALEDELADVDVVYVGGGNTLNMLTLWRVYGMDKVLDDLRKANMVFAGLSAGGMCWFDAGLTDSLGPQMSALHDCLGWLPGSFCPHFDSNGPAEAAYRSLVASGELPEGFGVDDGAALHFIDGELRRVVGERPDAGARRVLHDDEGVYYEDLEVDHIR